MIIITIISKERKVERERERERERETDRQTDRQTDGCFTMFVFLVSCDCYFSVALPGGAVGWFVVCGCGNS